MVPSGVNILVLIHGAKVCDGQGPNKPLPDEPHRKQDKQRIKRSRLQVPGFGKGCFSKLKPPG